MTSATAKANILDNSPRVISTCLTQAEREVISVALTLFSDSFANEHFGPSDLQVLRDLQQRTKFW
jgi:hypothetical protein